MIYYLKDNRTGKETPFFTVLKVKEKKDGFSFFFKCKNSKLYSANEGFNVNLYDGDVCEVFISTCGDINRYYEVEVAPNGSAFFKSVIKDGENRKSTAEEDVITRSVKKKKDGYNVKISIPKKYVNFDKNKKVMFNAYRIETEGGIKDKNLLAVNPTMCNTFHCPEYFIELNT